MKHEALKQLMDLIEKKYGDLDNDCGAYVNGRWLSVKAIADLIEQADNEN